MTSTGTFQGLADGRKSSKVLKPPGGGSSDIFGGGSEETSPRRVKNHNQSSVGTALFGDGPASTGSSSPDSPRANKPGNDSYKRLFGPPDPPTQNTKNHMRSNISLCGDQNNAVKINGVNGGTKINGSSIINGNANTNDDITDGNPVTGTGYAESTPSQNGSSSASSINGDMRSTTDSSPASVNNKPRTRVPPGGFSSGLW